MTLADVQPNDVRLLLSDAYIRTKQALHQLKGLDPQTGAVRPFLGALCAGNLKAFSVDVAGRHEMPVEVWQRARGAVKYCDDGEIDLSLAVTRDVDTLVHRFGLAPQTVPAAGTLYLDAWTFKRWIDRLVVTLRDQGMAKLETRAKRILFQMLSEGEVDETTGRHAVRQLLEEKLGGQLSDKGFDRVWKDAITKSGKVELMKPGRKPKSRVAVPEAR